MWGSDLPSASLPPSSTGGTFGWRASRGREAPSLFPCLPIWFPRAVVSFRTREGKRMSREEIYKELEEEFVSTFIDELIPGMLHNFANPLNGIIGRSKLLQKRIEENIKKTQARYPEAASEMLEDHRKMKTDIETIARESDKFFNIFRDVAEKFYIIAATEKEKVNLSRIIETEIRFADFYLDFKHEIKKELQLDQCLPEVDGLSADYSMFMWALIKYSKNRMKTASVKEFSVSTTHDNQYVFLKV